MSDLSYSDDDHSDQDNCSVDSDESDYNPNYITDMKNVHQVITEERKRLLVDYVNSRGLTIAKAARKLGLRYSTAKTIYSRHRKEGGGDDEADLDAEGDEDDQKPKKAKKGGKSKKEKDAEPKKKRGVRISRKTEKSDRAEPPTTRKRVKKELEEAKNKNAVPMVKGEDNSPSQQCDSHSTEFTKYNLKTELKTEDELENPTDASAANVKIETDPSQGKASDFQANIWRMMQEKAAMQSMINSYIFQQNLLRGNPFFHQNPYLNPISQMGMHPGMRNRPSPAEMEKIMAYNAMKKQQALEPVPQPSTN